MKSSVSIVYSEMHVLQALDKILTEGGFLAFFYFPSLEQK